MRASLTATLVLVGAASSVWLSSCANPERCSSYGWGCRVDDALPGAKGQPTLEVCSNDSDTPGGSDFTWKRTYCYALGDGGGPDNCFTQFTTGLDAGVVCASGYCICR